MAKDLLKIFQRAEALRARSDFKGAGKLYLDILKALKAPGGRVTEGSNELELWCLLSLGDTLRLTGDFKGSWSYYRRARSLASKLGMETEAVDSIVGEALALRATGELKEARELLQRALRFYRAGKDRAGEAFTLWARGGVLRFSGDVRGAMECFKRARVIFTRTRDKTGTAYTLSGLGGASRVLGRYALSKRYYAEANVLFRSQRDTFGIAYTYCGLGNALRMRGEFKESLKFFGRASTNYKKIGDIVSYAYTLWAEGTSLQMLGRDTEARKDFKEAEGLFKKTRDKRGLLYSKMSLSELDYTGANTATRKAAAKKRLAAALKNAKGAGFKVEAGYIKLILRTIDKAPEQLPLNLA